MGKIIFDNLTNCIFAGGDIGSKTRSEIEYSETTENLLR